MFALLALPFPGSHSGMQWPFSHIRVGETSEALSQLRGRQGMSAGSQRTAWGSCRSSVLSFRPGNVVEQASDSLETHGKGASVYHSGACSVWR